MPESRHHPSGEASQHCDSRQIESLIAQYQTNRDVTVLSSIVELTETRALTLIRFYRTTRYKSKDELLSDVNFKLIRAVEKFDPAKGSAFTFVSQVVMNALFTSVSNARKDAKRHRKLSKGVLNRLITNGETKSQYAIHDLAHRVRCGVKTTLENSKERDVQRWFVSSFIDERFSQRRHQCGDAAMNVFSLNHGRSRELYDLTMLEVRRVLYDELKERQPIIPGRLLGTKLGWMSQYAPLLDADEFTKFVVLMKNLSPFVLLLIDPQSRSRRGDRNPAIGRPNLLWILDGHPDAVPLFQDLDL